MQQRLPSRLDPPITFAHRGASAHAPENTLESFQLAVRLGASGVESDVWITADGIPVLDHDGVVRRGLRRRAIREVARSSLPDHIPSLHELLTTCPDVHLSLDIEDPDAAEAVIEVVSDHDRARLGSLWLCHPDLDVLSAIRARHDAPRLVNSTRLSRLKDGPERRAAALADRSIDVMNMHRTDWNGGLVVLFHRFERLAFGWDLQTDHELQTGFRMGLDAVYSDHVDLMHDAFTTEVELG